MFLTSDLTQEQKSRLLKLEKIKSLGIDPYPSNCILSLQIKQLLKNFEDYLKNQEKISIRGRLKLIRSHGGSTFANLEDESGELQIYFKKDILGEKQYEFLENLDIGDFIFVQGKVFITKKGEKTLLIENYSLLTKSLRPLPEKWHGLKDQELRYRKRYLDLITNKNIRDLFYQKSLFIKNIRQFLDNNGFLEVETPVLEHIPGGADARPFITHHYTLDIDLYLRISLELHLKRLIVGGYEKIYEIGKVFRNEGMSTQHLQEFTMLEFYWAYADWQDLMKMVEDFYVSIIKETFGSLKIKYQDQILDFTPPWPRLNYIDLILEKTGVNIEDYPDKESLFAKMKNLKGLRLNDLDIQNIGRGRLIDEFYKRTVRPNIIQPSFLINHPLDVSPLAKLDKTNPQRTERFQVLMVGAEVGNGFSELNDPIDQRQRFEDQMKLREAGDEEAQMLDDDFIEALEYGLPPTAGFGVGIDRLFMILSNSESIRDVVFFPTMRPTEKISSQIGL